MADEERDEGPGELEFEHDDLGMGERPSRPEPDEEPEPIAAEAERPAGNAAEPEEPAGKPEPAAAEPEQAANPEGEGDTAPEAEGEPQAAADPEPTVESLRAELAASRAEAESMRKGFVAEQARLRQRFAQQQQGAAPPPTAPGQITADQAAAAQSQGIPVEFSVDAQGNSVATIPPQALEQLRQGPAPTVEQQQVSAYHAWRDETFRADPIARGPALAKIDQAFDYMNARVQAKSMEMGYAPQSLDDAVAFMDQTGILAEVQQAYGDVVPDARAAFDLVSARNHVSPMLLQSVLDGYLSRTQAASGAAPAVPGAQAPAAAAPAAAPAPAPATKTALREIPADMPRSPAERGRQPVDADTRVDEIMDKDVLDTLSSEERREMLRALESTA